MVYNCECRSIYYWESYNTSQFAQSHFDMVAERAIKYETYIAVEKEDLSRLCVLAKQSWKWHEYSGQQE